MVLTDRILRRPLCLRPLRCSGLALLLLFSSAATIGSEPVEAQQPAGSTGGSSLSSTAVPDTITGQVVNASTGLPVARALVRFNDRAVLTDHDGNFHFAQNTDTSGNILVVKPGFYAAADPEDNQNLYLQANQLQAPLRLLLYPEALLIGTVTAPDGTPLPQVFVRARRITYGEGIRRMTFISQEQTDAHGRFRIPTLAGDYRVETLYQPNNRAIGLAVLPKSYPEDSASNTFSIKPGEEQHIDLHPAAGHAYSVAVVTDSPDAATGYLRMSAHSGNGSTFQINPIASPASGEMKISLPPGTYTLLATRQSADEPAEAQAVITVPDHDVSGPVLHFSTYPRIPVEMAVDSGSTSDKSDNSPPTLQQFNLTLQSDQPELEDIGATIRATTLPNHSFAFLAPIGHYRLQAQNSDEWFVKSVSYGASDLLQQDLVVAPGSAGTPIRVIISNQTGALQGIVKVNGNPSAGWIYLVPTGPSAESVIPLHAHGDGSYTFAHLPPGSYQAVAFENRHSANFRDPETLTRFATHVRSLTISAGDKPTLDLDAVSNAELNP